MSFEKFELLADAPDAVAKMREFVLELAVQGKLVEQNPADGDGHALLKLIHRENPRSDIETDVESVDAELPKLPISWATGKLGEVAEIIRGVSFPGSAKSETRSNGDVACLRTASVQAEINWDDLIYISPTHVSRKDQWVAPNDIMISMANSYALVGKVAIVREVPQKATFGAFLAAIRPILIEPYFLLCVLRSPRMQAALRASSSQTTNIANVSLRRMRPLPFPLPPLAEQKRIVAKVDELMALCDRLEAQQQERETRHAALTRASLARFADAPNPGNLHFLFHPSFAIPPVNLRKSVLTLAVQGKLVPQDPNDEPAEELLDRVKAARESLVVERRVRQSDEVEYSLQAEDDDAPPGWVGVHVNDVAIVQGGKRLPNGAVFSESPTPHAYIRVTDMKNGTISETGLRYISPEVQREIARYIINKEDLYITIAGTTGDVGCVPESLDGSNLTENAAKIVFRGFDRRFFQMALTSEFVQAQFLEKTKQMAQPKLALKRIAGAKFHLPPLAEQRRIVAKVERLMALVGELETQIAASRTTGADLIEAVVAELTAIA